MSHETTEAILRRIKLRVRRVVAQSEREREITRQIQDLHFDTHLLKDTLTFPVVASTPPEGFLVKRRNP